MTSSNSAEASSIRAVNSRMFCSKVLRTCWSAADGLGLVRAFAHFRQIGTPFSYKAVSSALQIAQRSITRRANITLRPGSFSVNRRMPKIKCKICACSNSDTIQKFILV